MTSIEELRNNNNMNQVGNNVENVTEDPTVDELDLINEEFKDPPSEKVTLEDTVFEVIPIPHSLRDPVIIFLLYFLLSLRPVQEVIGSFLSVTLPDEEGKVSYVGVGVYGLILAVLFFGVKYLLHEY